MILAHGDACKNSETTDPFDGGDADVLAAVRQAHCDSGGKKWSALLAVVAMGLDVDMTAFARNVERLSKRNAYFGRINLLTGETADGWNDHIGATLLPSDALDQARADYLALAAKVLVLNEADLTDQSKTKSHTAVVSFHAISGNFGLQRTFVPWEPVHDDGSRGVHVSEQHSWLYLFDAVQVENLKRELAGLDVS